MTSSLRHNPAVQRLRDVPASAGMFSFFFLNLQIYTELSALHLTASRHLWWRWAPPCVFPLPNDSESRLAFPHHLQISGNVQGSADQTGCLARRLIHRTSSLFTPSVFQNKISEIPAGCKSPLSFPWSLPKTTFPLWSFICWRQSNLRREKKQGMYVEGEQLPEHGPWAQLGEKQEFSGKETC